MGVRSLGMASSASSSSSASQNGFRSRRALEKKRLKNKTRQLRRTVFQNSSFFDRPRTSEFSFFKRFQQCLPEVHTPERDDRTIDSGSDKNDDLSYKGSYEENTGSHKDDGEIYFKRSKENRDLSSPTHTQRHNDGMLRGSKSDDGAIYTGNYKNIFTRIQHHLQELSSRSSKSKGPPRVETLLRRLDVVNPAISCEEKGHKLLQPGSPLLLEDEEDSHFEALKNWNIKEMTELAWSSGLSDDKSADWEGHVESHSQLKDDDGDSDYEALKTWNVKEMTRSAWSAGRFPNVDLSSQSIETDKLDSPGQLFEVPQQDLLSSLYSEPEEEKLSFEVTKDTLGLHSIDGNDSQLEDDGHSDCEELRSAGQFDISEIQEELRSAGRFDISEIQDEEEDGYNQGYDSPGKLFEVDSLCFKLEDDCPGKLFEVSQHDSVSFKPEEENFDFEFPKNPLDGIYKSGARLALQSLVGFTTGNSDTLDW